MILFYGKYENHNLQASNDLIFKVQNVLKNHYQEQIGDFQVATKIDRSQGKPRFLDGDLKFSLSHSNDVFLLGFSKSEIGVDIEKIKDVKDFGLYEKLNAKNNLDFFEKWTKIEALAKFDGTSIVKVIKDLNFDKNCEKYDFALPFELQNVKEQNCGHSSINIMTKCLLNDYVYSIASGESFDKECALICY